ncbi:MAG TPA: prevent-host-death protein [Gammaproteobacteria bacterium]|nr:prevent-host-death protein [Gammaproteobacteria bacterium]
MQTLSIREVRSALSHLDEVLNTTNEIIITKHGEAIARITSIKGKRMRPTHEDLHLLTKKLAIPSEKLIRDERDER